MKKNLIVAAVLAVGTMVSGTASAFTFADWAAGAGACVGTANVWCDAGGEHRFTFGSTTLPGSTSITITELGIPGVGESYQVDFGFGQTGFTGAATVSYSVSTLNPLEGWTQVGIDSQALTAGGGTLIEKSINSGAFALSSVNGAPQTVGLPWLTTLTVNESFNTTGGVIEATHNQFLVQAVPEPEAYAMMLAALGALGFVARRRKAA